MYPPVNYLANVEDITRYYQTNFSPLFQDINIYFEKHQIPVPDVLSSLEKGLKEALSDPNTPFMVHFDYNRGQSPIVKTGIMVHGVNYLRENHPGDEKNQHFSLRGIKEVITLTTSKDSVSASIYKWDILKGKNDLIMEYDQELSDMIHRLFVALDTFAMFYDKGKLRYLEKPYYTLAMGRIHGHLNEAFLNNRLYSLWDEYILSFMDKMLYHLTHLVDELKQREYHLELIRIVNRDTNTDTAIKLVDPDTGNLMQYGIDNNFFAFSYQGHYYEYSDNVTYTEEVTEPCLEYTDPNKVRMVLTKDHLSLTIPDHDTPVCYTFTDYHHAIQHAIRYITNNIIPRG